MLYMQMSFEVRDVHVMYLHVYFVMERKILSMHFIDLVIHAVSCQNRNKFKEKTGGEKNLLSTDIKRD